MNSKLKCTRCGRQRVIATGITAEMLTAEMREDIAAQIGWIIDGDEIQCDNCNIEMCGKDYQDNED